MIRRRNRERNKEKAEISLHILMTIHFLRRLKFDSSAVMSSTIRIALSLPTRTLSANPINIRNKYLRSCGVKIERRIMAITKRVVCCIFTISLAFRSFYGATSSDRSILWGQGAFPRTPENAKIVLRSTTDRGKAQSFQEIELKRTLSREK